MFIFVTLFVKHLMLLLRSMDTCQTQVLKTALRQVFNMQNFVFLSVFYLFVVFY